MKYLGVLLLLHSFSAQAAVKQFNAPQVGGFRMDRCLSHGQGCNEPAAYKWCLEEGYEKAIYWEILDNKADIYPTKTLGSGSVCTKKSCDSFKLIVCYKT